jgi:ubiquinol-cytochrome c reductase cytochrome b subunit
VVPGIMFTLLAAWPFLEARFSGDRGWHNFAQKPREAPLRSGLGAAAVALMVVLFLAGSNDVLAKYLQIEVDTFNTVLRWSAFVLPVVAGVATFLVCRDLRDRPRSPIARPEAMTVRRTTAGGFEELHEPRAGAAADDEVRAP